MRERFDNFVYNLLEAGHELHEANEAPVRRFVYWHTVRILIRFTRPTVIETGK